MRMLSFRASGGGFGDFRCIQPSGRAESVGEEAPWIGAACCFLPSLTDLTSCYSPLLECGPLHSPDPAHLRAFAPAVPVPASPG